MILKDQLVSFVQFFNPTGDLQSCTFLHNPAQLDSIVQEPVSPVHSVGTSPVAYALLRAVGRACGSGGPRGPEAPHKMAITEAQAKSLYY